MLRAASRPPSEGKKTNVFSQDRSPYCSFPITVTSVLTDLVNCSVQVMMLKKIWVAKSYTPWLHSSTMKANDTLFCNLFQKVQLTCLPGHPVPGANRNLHESQVILPQIRYIRVMSSRELHSSAFNKCNVDFLILSGTCPLGHLRPEGLFLSAW